VLKAPQKLLLEIGEVLIYRSHRPLCDVESGAVGQPSGLRRANAAQRNQRDSAIAFSDEGVGHMAKVVQAFLRSGHGNRRGGEELGDRHVMTSAARASNVNAM
jgi:hypothetical protein